MTYKLVSSYNTEHLIKHSFVTAAL